mmetsp:Transcript_16728/g.53283  ORF Transcript_16728/g.53283 Transcript_16728/m.53283 type:complete len:203 (-) Transcript_16728:122-730(-)
MAPSTAVFWPSIAMTISCVCTTEAPSLRAATHRPIRVQQTRQSRSSPPLCRACSHSPATETRTGRFAARSSAGRSSARSCSSEPSPRHVSPLASRPARPPPEPALGPRKPLRPGLSRICPRVCSWPPAAPPPASTFLASTRQAAARSSCRSSLATLVGSMHASSTKPTPSRFSPPARPTQRCASGHSSALTHKHEMGEPAQL